MKPEALLFDFVETVADIRNVPKESLRTYAKKAADIADGRTQYSSITFGVEWRNAFVPAWRKRELDKLRKKVRVGVLTNSPLDFVVDVSRESEVVWDFILCGEMFRRCKPDSVIYLEAARVLQFHPAQIIMVAAHKFDTDAAAKVGMSTFNFEPGESLEPLIEVLS